MDNFALSASMICARSALPLGGEYQGGEALQTNGNREMSAMKPLIAVAT